MAKINHGIMLISATLVKDGYAKIGAGAMHYYSIYYFPSQTTIKTNVFSLNMDAGVVPDAIEGPLGRPYSAFQHPNGKIYYGTFVSWDIPGGLASYDFENRVLVELANVPGPVGAGNQDGIIQLTYSDEVDNPIYGLTCTRGRLFVFDITTGLATDLGVLDDPEGTYTTYNRYGTSIQVDTTHAYIGFKSIEPGDNIDYLIKKQLSDGAETLVWKADGCSAVGVYRGTNGSIYVSKTLSGTTTWYAIDDFVNDIAQPNCYTLNTRSTIVYTGYVYQVNWAYPDGRGGKTVPIYYRKPGDSADRLLEADLVNVDDYEVRRAGEDFNGDLICFAESYGPTTKLSTAAVKSSVGIFRGLSGYSICLDRHRGIVWVGGYPRGVEHKWNPAAAWDYDADNPKQMTVEDGGVTDARYTYGIHQGTDKNMWFGFDWVRAVGTRNSDIGWYDPDDDTTGLISATVPGAGGDANLNTYNMENFARDRVGLRMVFSSYTATDSVLAVVPVWKKGVSKYLRPLVGDTRQGKIVNVGTNKATANHFVGITVGASYKIYCVDIGTNELVWGPFTKTGTSFFLAGSGPLFAHGYVWYFVGDDIYKLDPTDVTGTPVKAYDGSDNGIVAGGLYWPPTNSPKADSLFHWESISKNVFEIPKADLGIT